MLILALITAIGWTIASMRVSGRIERVSAGAPFVYQDVIEGLATLLIVANLAYWSLWILTKHPGAWTLKTVAAMLLLCSIQAARMKWKLLRPE